MQQFLRIPEFQHTPKTEIQALVQCARVLCLPARRWLLRDGRQLEAFLYLLQGSLAVGHDHLVARTSGPLQHFYPGSTNIRTTSAAQVLWVDASQHEFLSKRAQSTSVISDMADTQWLQRFLDSPMMRRVSPAAWQQLVNSFSHRAYAAGATILHKGARGDVCFVIQTGHVVVHDGSRTLCHLGPGDFFGEDALVTGGCRNASVTALQAVRLQCIDKDVFSRLLLNQLIEFVPFQAGGQRLRLADGRKTAVGAIALVDVRDHIRQLDRKSRYYISGGNASQRALAALLLIQQGLAAFPLAGDVQNHVCCED
ncbi:MAG: cyclic nucleotide-binding domain-containing protein [bacterium]